MDFRETFGTDAPILGMVHLPALPGAPGYDGDREAIRRAAVRDAKRLEDGGVDGVLVENYGDSPFYPDDVPKHVVAEMTAVVDAVGEVVDGPIGVNVLRNDVEAALSVAGATGAAFVRANQHLGVRVTDQGLVEGRAHETVRLRERIDADVAMFADVAVKHSAPLAERPLETLVDDAVDRGHADAVVVSGPATGERTDRDDLRTVADAAPDDVPVVVGSGVTADNVGSLLEIADGAIVGTAFKVGGETTAPVDVDRVSALCDRRE